MNDTPQHIKDLQLQIWLSKSPEERLLLTLKSNADMLRFWASARFIDQAEKINGQSDLSPKKVDKKEP
jgi:hypothetical protein